MQLFQITKCGHTNRHQYKNVLNFIKDWSICMPSKFVIVLMCSLSTWKDISKFVAWAIDILQFNQYWQPKLQYALMSPYLKKTSVYTYEKIFARIPNKIHTTFIRTMTWQQMVAITFYKVKGLIFFLISLTCQCWIMPKICRLARYVMHETSHMGLAETF